MGACRACPPGSIVSEVPGWLRMEYSIRQQHGLQEEINVNYYYDESIKLLLIPYSKETVEVVYAPYKFALPLIAIRPPFYANPRLEAEYPVA